MPEIRAIGDRKNNAELIADCHELGYIKGLVLDATYGQGRFWKKLGLVGDDFEVRTNDIDGFTAASFNYDFTNFPHDWAGAFNTVVFDPPYKLNGTGGSHPSDAGYGVANKGRDRWSLIQGGLHEAIRVSAPGGHLLVKCQDQVCSGRKVWQTLNVYGCVTTTPSAMPMTLVDQLHVCSYRPQPAGRRQLHSRQDYSTLLVFRKAKS